MLRTKLGKPCKGSDDRWSVCLGTAKRCMSASMKAMQVLPVNHKDWHSACAFQHSMPAWHGSIANQCITSSCHRSNLMPALMRPFKEWRSSQASHMAMGAGVVRALPNACMRGRGWSGSFSICLACSWTSLACQGHTLSL